MQMAARNHELLQFLDPALNLAFRVSGNAADAEDILQDAYLRAVKVTSPILSGHDLRNWFFQVTANVARDWLRSERSRRTREGEAAMDQNVRAATPTQSGAKADELKLEVEAELARLDEKLRLPVSLHYEHGLSYEDAAAVLGLTPGTLRVYVSQGVQELREKLNARGRSVTSEILLALLGAGLALKASPALAASVKTIVAKAAASEAAGVTGAAKTAGTGAKPFIVLANTGRTGLAVYAGFATAACVTLLATLVWFVFYHSENGPQPAPNGISQNPAVTEPVEETPVAAQPAAQVAQTTPVEPLFEDRVIAMKHLTPASLTWPEFDKALGAAKSVGGQLSVEWRVDACNLRIHETPDGFFRMQQVIDVYDVAEVDFKTDAATNEAWAAADNLIPLVDTGHYFVSGSWAVEGDSLVGRAGDYSRVAIPYVPPDEYDYRIDFTRKAGAFSEINMIFPADGAQRILRMDSWGACHFGEFKDNPDAVPTTIANGVRHTAIVQVRHAQLSAYIDGTLITSIDIGKSSSLCQEAYRLPDKNSIGVGAWRNEMVFHRIAIRAVSGKGAPHPPDPDAANSISEDYWKDALDVMPKVFNPRNALGGKWRLQNGALAAETAPYNRYQIDYVPPEEYDFRAVFTRIDGKGEFAQIAAAAGTQFLWKVDSSGMSILDSIGGKGWDKNPTFIHTPGLAPNGTQHVSVVCVRKTGVKTFVDGKLIAMRWTDYTDFSIERVWKLNAPHAIGIGFHNSQGRVDKLQIKEVTGKGHWLSKTTMDNQDGDAF